MICIILIFECDRTDNERCSVTRLLFRMELYSTMGNSVSHVLNDTLQCTIGVVILLNTLNHLAE